MNIGAGHRSIAAGNKGSRKKRSSSRTRAVCLKINYTVNMTRVSKDTLGKTWPICSCLHVCKSARPVNESLILCAGMGRKKDRVLMYTSYNSPGERVGGLLLIDGVEHRGSFLLRAMGKRQSAGSLLISASVSRSEQNSAAAALNQPQRLT